MKNKTKEIHNSIMKIGASMLALAVAAGASTPAITSFTQAQPVTKTKKKAKAKKKTKAKKTKSKKKKSYKAKAGTISLSPITLTKGKSKTVSVKTKSKVKWTSSNAKVATVKSISKSKVKVTAKKEGSTKVSGKAGKAKWSFTVKVKKANPKPTGKNTKKKTTKTNTSKKKTSTSQKSKKTDTQKTKTALLDNNIKAILHECGADAGTSDIQKFARLCHWWSLNVKYGENYPANAEDAIFKKYGTYSYEHSGSAAYITDYKIGVCGTQAQAFEYFGNLAGLKSKCIVGKESNHEWLHVYLDDGWYSFDPTDFAIEPCLTYEDYLNTNDGKKSYQGWFNAAFKHGATGATKGDSTSCSEWANNRTFEGFKKHTYHIASTELNDSFNSGNTDGKGLRGGPYSIDGSGNGWEPISDSDCNGELNGRKYINVLLYEYL